MLTNSRAFDNLLIFDPCRYLIESLTDLPSTLALWKGKSYSLDSFDVLFTSSPATKQTIRIQHVFHNAGTVNDLGIVLV